MPILIGFCVVLGIAIALFIVLAALQPEDFSLARSEKVNATPAQVFAQINDFHNWEHWSPWAKIDPTMQTTYEGPAAGKGASYSWNGNKKVGAGKMTMTESRPPQLIHINLEFFRPFQATNQTEFALKPEGQGTTVTWTMTGKRNFFLKAFSLFVSMEKMVGPDFEKGLAQLKSIVEGGKA
jgi:carbon monoxide dehydrogenase subunit G